MKPESLPARTAAQELIEFAHGLTLRAIPRAVLEAAKRCLLDALGCALFGSRQPWSRIMAEEMLAEGSRGRASIVGRRKTVPAPAAALCNGTAIHGFELDDLIEEAIVHPGAIVIPAALAAAEALDRSGARLVTSIVAGYEAIHRVGLALGLDPARRGHHMTALAGPVGAAIAAGVVAELRPAQLSAAVGLACSTSSGTKSFAAGSGGGMMKRMHAGRAAEAGVRMAQLAARGFTAPPTALDGRFGLLEVFSGPSARPEELRRELGRRWAIEQVYFKVYPCCAWIQAAVQQLVALRGPRPVEARAVESVRIGVCSYAARNNGNAAPLDTMGAQYSLPYSAAAALTGDPSDPAIYGERAIADRARRALAQRVELAVDPEMEAAYPRHYGARVELKLAGQPRKESAVLDPHGMPADPLSEQERVAKFYRLGSRAKPRKVLAAILAAVQRVERLRSARELGALLRG